MPLIEGCCTFPAAPCAASTRHTALPCGSFCAFDGRLDAAAPDRCPAATALDAWLRNALDGLLRLVGDWSLAIWDAAAASIVLASDYAGIRPLFYHCSGARLRWSSSLGDLVRQTGARPLDEIFAGQFLTLAPTRHTPYPGVCCVPPGCAVVVSATGTSIRRFWRLPSAAERADDETACERHLLELFREAVAVRVRPHARVAAELSGGLDSSSVACMATELGAPLTTFSYTHPGSTDDRYFRAVEADRGIAGIHLNVSDYPFVTPQQTGGAAPGWWEPRFHGLARHLSALGAEALLTGQMGDFTMRNVLDDSDQVSACFRRGQFGLAAREAFAWSQSLRVPIYPILWRSLRLAFTSWAPPGNSDLSPVNLRRLNPEDSLTERFRRRSAEAAAAAEPYDLRWRDTPPERRRRGRALADMLHARRLQTPEPLLGFSWTHPFAHRPLVEFMLTVPRRLLCRPGEPRLLMRRAFRALLPEPVLRRRSKADYNALYAQALRPLAQRMLDRLGEIRLAELGFLDLLSLQSRIERFLHGLDCNAVQLRQIILLETWLATR